MLSDRSHCGKGVASMNDDFFLNLVVHSIGQMPYLLAYLACLTIAVVMRRRCPIPSLLTVTAMVALLVNSIGRIVIYTYALQLDMQWLVATKGLIDIVVQLLAIGLLVTAVFIGRNASSTPEPAMSPL